MINKIQITKSTDKNVKILSITICIIWNLTFIWYLDFVICHFKKVGITSKPAIYF